MESRRSRDRRRRSPSSPSSSPSSSQDCTSNCAESAECRRCRSYKRKRRTRKARRRSKTETPSARTSSSLTPASSSSQPFLTLHGSPDTWSDAQRSTLRILAGHDDLERAARAINFRRAVQVAPNQPPRPSAALGRPRQGDEDHRAVQVVPNQPPRPSAALGRPPQEDEDHRAVQLAPVSGQGSRRPSGTDRASGSSHQTRRSSACRASGTSYAEEPQPSASVRVPRNLRSRPSQEEVSPRWNRERRGLFYDIHGHYIYYRAVGFPT